MISGVKTVGQEQIQRMLAQANKKSVKFANRTIRHIARRFFISARVATKPGRRSQVEKMNKKYRVRRVESLSLSKQKSLGQFWYKDLRNNRIFQKSHLISFRSRKATGDLSSSTGVGNNRLQLLKRGIKAWSKKQKKFVYYGTTLSRGLHQGVKSNKRSAAIGTNIPGAGAAKAGWNQGLKNIGFPKGSGMGRNTRKVGTTRWRRGTEPRIKHTNEVDYVSNTSPMAMYFGITNAAKFFKTKEKKRWDKKVKSEFKR